MAWTMAYHKGQIQFQADSLHFHIKHLAYSGVVKDRS